MVGEEDIIFIQEWFFQGLKEMDFSNNFVKIIYLHPIKFQSILSFINLYFLKIL